MTKFIYKHFITWFFVTFFQFKGSSLGLETPSNGHHQEQFGILEGHPPHCPTSKIHPEQITQ